MKGRHISRPFSLRRFCGAAVHPAFTKQSRRNRQCSGTSRNSFRCQSGNAEHVRRYSMSNRFLISVAAAALIAGTGVANAQGTGMGHDAGSAGSTAQQSAPSSDRSAAPSGTMQRDSGGTSGMKGADSAEGRQGGATGRRQERSGQQPDAGREVEEHALRDRLDQGFGQGQQGNEGRGPRRQERQHERADQGRDRYQVGRQPQPTASPRPRATPQLRRPPRRRPRSARRSFPRSGRRRSRKPPT